MVPDGGGGLMLMLTRSMQSRERERESSGAIFNSVSDPWAGGTTEKAKMEPKYAIGSDK